MCELVRIQMRLCVRRKARESIRAGADQAVRHCENRSRCINAQWQKERDESWRRVGTCESTRRRKKERDRDRERERESSKTLLFGSPVALSATLDSRAATASAVSSAQ